MPGTRSQERPHNQDHDRRQAEDEETQDVMGRTGDAADVEDVDLDSVLDDISSALESNAEEYVSGFVQQGGQ
ncbi:ubiquitin-like protein Pup [uncultured Bifidobacterium sp.]|uniref:ubiquitin-like protein Pup n=1 Tax=uncultured Bifidobacterium sp. TaxID=165187 RepID=UPI002608BA22|nr:ubiquitin-like protein Pup [uncultured Bifidobacterium sp.]